MGKDPRNMHPNELINHRIISPTGPPPHGPAYFPDNPGPMHHLVVQDATNMRHGINRSGQRTFIDRFPQVPDKIRPMKLKAELNRELDANENAYNPSKYPNPGQSVTHFPARKLPAPPMNGHVCAYNPLTARPLPFSGTNDVAYVVSRF